MNVQAKRKKHFKKVLEFQKSNMGLTLIASKLYASQNLIFRLLLKISSLKRNGYF